MGAVENLFDKRDAQGYVHVGSWFSRGGYYAQELGPLVVESRRVEVEQHGSLTLDLDEVRLVHILKHVRRIRVVVLH